MIAGSRCAHDFRASDVCARCGADRPFYAVCPHELKGLEARACRDCRGFVAGPSVPQSTPALPQGNTSLSRRSRRWAANAMSPKRAVLDSDSACRRCGAALRVGQEVLFVAFASGGMHSCVDCAFWLPLEPRQ